MSGLNRTKIINFFINKVKAKSYLEIGVASGRNFTKINCIKKVGVDPSLSSPATFHMISDSFFSANRDLGLWGEDFAHEQVYFDVIFVDGLHHGDQVEKDINNSLKILNTGGVIVCHDMKPKKQMQQVVPRISKQWTGDCWKAWVNIRRTRPDLEMYVIDVDWGCGVIKKGSQDILDISKDDVNWDNFNQNKTKWLNLISEKDFYEKYDQSREVGLGY